jgi:hypothetical protein
MPREVSFHVYSSPERTNCFIDCRMNPLRHLATGIADTVLGMINEYEDKKNELLFRLELMAMVEFLYSLVKGTIHNKTTPCFAKEERELIAIALCGFNDLLQEKLGNPSANWTDLNAEFLNG